MVAPVACANGMSRRSTNASGSSVAKQKMPMPTWVARQPELSMKWLITGGHTVPAR
jgi:hypothetical protein